MSKVRVRTAALAVALAGAILAPASAQDEFGWIGDGNANGAVLIYGIPDSDAVGIAFRCEPGGKVRVSLAPDTLSGRDGDSYDLVLSATGVGDTVTINAVGARSELDDGFVLDGATPLTPALRAILLASGDLIATVNGREHRFPLAGADVAAAGLLEICG